MATNADDILSAASIDAANQAAMNDDVMAKHFEMAGIEADETNDTTTQEGENSQTQAGENNSQQQSGDQQQANTKDSTGDAKDGNNQQQPKQEGQKKEGDNQLADGSIKLSDGTVLTTPIEKRLHSELTVERQRQAVLRNDLNQTKQSRDNLRQQLETVRNTAQSLHGAQPEHVRIGLNIVRDLQSDPVGTVKKLVAECLAAGHTIDNIQAGLNAEVLALIGNKLNQSNVQQGPSEDDINRQVADEVNKFYTQYPDARTHDALIARVLQDHPDMTLTDVYFELKSEFARKGFNWNVPFNQQVQQRNDQQQQQANNNQQQQKPMTNGRAPVNPANANRTVVAPETMDTGDIVKMAMREAGMNI